MFVVCVCFNLSDPTYYDNLIDEVLFSTRIEKLDKVESPFFFEMGDNISTLASASIDAHNLIHYKVPE
jgi:hypothetical protein